jgi:pimeloyl-ACP methyl ester carboxylesterase
MGETAEIPAEAGTLDFMLHAKTRRVTIDGQDVAGLVVAPNQAQDQILLAGSSKAKPGEYAVTLSAISATGEEMHTNVDVVVKPRLTVPNGSTRPPVVLLNGWITGFANACAVATSSVTTFGNLAQYLVLDGVPVVYLFDNCLEGPNEPIETLGNDLGTFLNQITYDDGTQVPQIDLVAHSMGGLIARAYLAALQPNETYLPPAPSLVRDLVTSRSRRCHGRPSAPSQGSNRPAQDPRREPLRHGRHRRAIEPFGSAASSSSQLARQLN